MSSIDSEVTRLESAFRAFVQFIKRPQQWAQITEAAGVQLDRPAAVILQTLIVHRPKQLGVLDLAQILGIEPPSVTRKTQQLEHAGYLRRLPNPQDRRAVSLEVTAAGLQVATRLGEAQRLSMRNVLKKWSSNDRRQFVTLFERFAQELSTTTNKSHHTT